MNKLKLLELLNSLPTGDYIRIRDNKHEFIARWSSFAPNNKYITLINEAYLDTWETLVNDETIKEGDTLYRIEDINSVQVKPLIYL